MKKYTRQKGSLHVVMIVAAVIIVIVLLVFVYIFRQNNISSNKTTSKSNSKVQTDKDASIPANNDNKVAEDYSVLLNDESTSKLYSNDLGNFSVRYPSNWTIETSVHNSNTYFVTEAAKITTENGNTISLSSGYTPGRGGTCVGKDGEVPFQKGNSCPSLEYISSEFLPINSIYYYNSKEKTSVGKMAFEKLDIVLLSAHYMNTDGSSKYFIAMDGSPSSYPVEINKLIMGYILPEFFIDVYDKDKKSYPTLYVYSESDSADFLSSTDAEAIKAVIRTVKVDI